jgi:heptosyltransferase II
VQILNLLKSNLLWPRLRHRLARPSIGRWVAPLRTLRQLWGWRPGRIPLDKARNILVIRPDEIGDVVLTSPFLRELRRAAPRARIILLVKMGCRELVEYCPYVDAVYSLDFEHRKRLRWAAWCLRWGRMPWRGFDLVLLPRSDVDWYDSELVGHILAGRGALLVHRIALVKRSSHFWVNPPFMVEAYFNPQVEHEVLQALRFLRWCGATDATDCALEVWLRAADRVFARAWLDHHLMRRAPLIVLHPSGGRSKLKQWPLANFRTLLNQLNAETSCNFLIIGGKDESWITSEFAREASERVVLAVGQFTLCQLIAVLEQAQCFLGGDTGPMHLAAAVKTPVIGIFGPTSELRFRPWGRHCRVVSQRYPCSPDVLGTFQDRCQTCLFPEPRCLTELSIDSVISELRAVISSH